MPNAISDAKLGLEKINEFGLARARFRGLLSITIAEPDMCKASAPNVVQGIRHRRQLGFRRARGSDRQLKTKYKNHDTQNVIRPMRYWLMKAALEKAAKRSPCVAQAFRTMDGGPSKHTQAVSSIRRKGPPRWRRGMIVQCNPARPLRISARSPLAAPFWPEKL